MPAYAYLLIAAIPVAFAAGWCMCAFMVASREPEPRTAREAESK